MVLMRLSDGRSTIAKPYSLRPRMAGVGREKPSAWASSHASSNVKVVRPSSNKNSPKLSMDCISGVVDMDSLQPKD